MAIVAPGVEYRQLSGKSTTALTHDIVCVHTMVGTLEGSIAWSARAGNSYWHFGIGGSGKTVQCQDLAYRSAANLNGNWHVIPIETADLNEGFFPTPWQNPPWTAQQIDALVNLISWLCVRFNIPPVVIPDTRPGRRGLAYHRQGIDPWRVSGGELWSSTNGKICPANRIDQFLNIVVPRVRDRVLGVSPPPQPKDDDMPWLQRNAQTGAIHLMGDPTLGPVHLFGATAEDFAAKFPMVTVRVGSDAEWLVQRAVELTTGVADDIEMVRADLADEEPASPPG